MIKMVKGYKTKHWLKRAEVYKNPAHPDPTTTKD